MCVCVCVCVRFYERASKMVVGDSSVELTPVGLHILPNPVSFLPTTTITPVTPPTLLPFLPQYNSNSGFVEDGIADDGHSSTAQGYLRATPQAFSHFTYQASGRRAMVVDMQGVGDLMTDPQVRLTDSLTYTLDY